MSIEFDPRMPMETAQDEEYVLSIQDLLKVIRRRMWVIMLTAMLFVGTAIGFSLLQTPVYEASIKILVGQERNGDAPANFGSDVQGLQQITLTMAEAVDTDPVADAVTQELNLQESPEAFLEDLSVEQTANTQFIEISYKDTSASQAQRIVNTIGEKFAEQVSDVSPSANAITVTMWEQAATPEAPVSPNPLRNGLLALVVGGMLGVGLAFLLEHLDDSWRSPEEVEQVSGIPTFGVIPEFDAPKVKKGDK